MQNLVLLKGGYLRITVPSKKKGKDGGGGGGGGRGGEGGPGPPDRKKAPLSEFFVVSISSLSSTF